jgi:hypothetical protein
MQFINDCFTVAIRCGIYCIVLSCVLQDLANEQASARFELGEVVQAKGGSAVFWHHAEFDGYVTGQSRFLVDNSTMFCGDDMQAVQQAYSSGSTAAPVYVLASGDLPGNDGAASGDVAKWLVPTVILSCAGLLLLVLWDVRS